MLDVGQVQNDLSGDPSLSYEVRNESVCETRVVCLETEYYLVSAALREHSLSSSCSAHWSSDTNAGLYEFYLYCTAGNIA